MKVLHILTSGQAGGIESLCRDIGIYSEFDNLFCFMTQGGDIYEQMKSLGLNTENIGELGRGIKLSKIRRLLSLSKECDVIVVHHGDPYMKLYFMIVGFLSKKAMVSIIHSCYVPMTYKKFKKIKQFIWDAILKHSLYASDAIIYVANAGKKSYEERFGEISVDNFVVYNGISVEKIENGKLNQYCKEKPINVTYIGRLEEIKGVDNLIKAISILKDRFDIKLSIVGDGTDRERLEKLTYNLKLDGMVSFYGQQINISEYLSKASVFVYPSICPEIFGISLVEAMAYGIPCVSNMVGGIPEVIENGISGFLCETFEPSELAEKIEMVIKSDCTAVIENGRKKAQGFSILNTVKNLETIFLKISEK